MAAPRQPKGNPTLSDDARTELQRKELDALHNKLAKRGIDDGKRRDLFRATEVPGGFEGRLERELSEVQQKRGVLNEMLERRTADHTQLHLIHGIPPCESLTKCAHENADCAVGMDAFTLKEIGILSFSTGYQAFLVASRTADRLGPASASSYGAIVDRLVRPAKDGDLGLSYREVALLRIEARGLPLPFAEKFVESEANAVKKARSEYIHPRKNRSRGKGPKLGQSEDPDKVK